MHNNKKKKKTDQRGDALHLVCSLKNIIGNNYFHETVLERRKFLDCSLSKTYFSRHLE